MCALRSRRSVFFSPLRSIALSPATEKRPLVQSDTPPVPHRVHYTTHSPSISNVCVLKIHSCILRGVPLGVHVVLAIESVSELDLEVYYLPKLFSRNGRQIDLTHICTFHGILRDYKHLLEFQ